MMLLPRWLDDELQGRGLAFAAVGMAALVLAGWLLWVELGQPARPSAVPVAAGPASLTPRTDAAAPAAAEAASAAVVLPDCPHQQLDITTADGLQRGCVSATRTRQTGSVRSHMVEPEGVSAWRLAVDTAGGQIISVRLSHPAQGPTPAAFYVCEAPACQGIALGRPDARGVRVLNLEEVALQALPPGRKWQRRPPAVAAPPPAAASGPALPSVRVSGRLQTLPDRQNPALACSVGGVSVVEGDGALTDFCPMGGAGFELTDAGRPRFEFRTLEGQSLVVALAADGSVEQVKLGALRCKAPACGGVSMQVAGDPANPAAARRFDFSGTTLKAASPPTASATLNGSLSMASQE